jgi:hypothetical protein
VRRGLGWLVEFHSLWFWFWREKYSNDLNVVFGMKLLAEVFVVYGRNGSFCKFGAMIYVCL